MAPTAISYVDIDGDGLQDLLLTFDLRDLLEFGDIDDSTNSFQF